MGMRDWLQLAAKVGRENTHRAWEKMRIQVPWKRICAYAVLVFGVVGGSGSFFSDLLASAPAFSYVTARVNWWKVGVRKSDEILVLIAPFEYVGSAADNKDHLVLTSPLRDAMVNAGVDAKRLRIEHLPRPLDEEDGEADARDFAEAKNASFVLWGQVAGNRTRLSLFDRSSDELLGRDEVLGAPKSIVAWGNRFLLPTISLSLPETSKALNFLALWSVGRNFYHQQDLDRAEKILQRAVELVYPRLIAGEKIVGAEADGFYQIWAAFDYMRSIVHDGKPTMFSPEFLRTLESSFESRSLMLDFDLFIRHWVNVSAGDSAEDILSLASKIETRVLAEGSDLIKAGFYLQRGIIKKELGDRLGAGSDFFVSRQYIASSPAGDDIRALFMGQSLEWSEDFRGCSRELSARLRGRESTDLITYELWKQLAGCQFKAGDLDEAILTLDIAIKASRHRHIAATLRHRKASFLENAHRDDEAARVRQENIRLNPEYSWDRHNLAMYHLRRKEFSEARDLELFVARKDGFLKAYQGLAHAGLGLGLDAESFVRDVAPLTELLIRYADDRSIPTEILRAILLSSFQTIDVRDGVSINWPIAWPAEVSTVFAAELDLHAIFLFSDLENTDLALRYIEAVSERGFKNTQLLKLAGLFCSTEAILAFRNGDLLSAEVWVRKAVGYGFADAASFNYLMKQNPSLAQIASTVPHIDFTKAGFSLGEKVRSGR